MHLLKSAALRLSARYRLLGIKSKRNFCKTTAVTIASFNLVKVLELYGCIWGILISVNSI